MICLGLVLSGEGHMIPPVTEAFRSAWPTSITCVFPVVWSADSPCRSFPASPPYPHTLESLDGHAHRHLASSASSGVQAQSPRT